MKYGLKKVFSSLVMFTCLELRSFPLFMRPNFLRDILAIPPPLPCHGIWCNSLWITLQANGLWRPFSLTLMCHLSTFTDGQNERYQQRVLNPWHSGHAARSLLIIYSSLKVYVHCGENSWTLMRHHCVIILKKKVNSYLHHRCLHVPVWTHTKKPA